MLCAYIQERTDDVEQRRTAIDKASREHAQLKLQRDDLTNQRKSVLKKITCRSQTTLPASCCMNYVIIHLSR